MPPELFETMKYGGAVAIILATGWLLIQINAIIGKKNDNNGKRMSLSEYSNLSQQISNLGENHLHEIKDSIDLLREDMNRNFSDLNHKQDKMNEYLIWIKSRLNGKS